MHTVFARDKPVPAACSALIIHGALNLNQFNYNLVYSRSKDNVNSDGLNTSNSNGGRTL